jgi:radical SAM superfamily enzyme YgiQ (UPF0313 family)
MTVVCGKQNLSKGDSVPRFGQSSIQEQDFVPSSFVLRPRILLLTPPLTQLNTPYPATPYLTGFLRPQGFDCRQGDLSLDLMLKLLSREGLHRVRDDVLARASAQAEHSVPTSTVPTSKSVRWFQREFERYANTIDAVIRFLQGRDPTVALKITTREFLPEGPRFQAMKEYQSLEAQLFGGAPEEHEGLSWAFGSLGSQDRAKFLASLYIDDLADIIREGIDPEFGLSRYAEKLAASQPTFDPLLERLNGPSTLVDRMLDELTVEWLERERPNVLALTAPFPGNVYGAFRIARTARRVIPDIKIVFGGGYANTELRSLKDPRVFDYFDFLSLDDGERPFLCILEYLAGAREKEHLLRTYLRVEGRVHYSNGASEHDIPHKDVGTPTYDGLRLDRYLSILEMLNPMHRVWSDGRWNKLTLAHGCYWKKCNFCDVTLDYIGRYDGAPGKLIVDRMESLINETGQSGFHFVDEAAPPAALRSMSEELLARGLSATWWGNVRFEKTFTPSLASLMARAGCVAVSGGLEVASDRLLKLMNKGVTVEQVARVTKAFTEAGIMVHAYLMYGFPTQTVQETIDALERVRQLFEAGCIQSAYWHRFSATIHSPIGKDPDRFGLEITGGGKSSEVSFAQNDLQFVDPTGVDHDGLGIGLRKALYNYMLGLGLDQDVRSWFEGVEVRAPGSRGKLIKVPKAQVPADLISRAIS